MTDDDSGFTAVKRQTLTGSRLTVSEDQSLITMLGSTAVMVPAEPGILHLDPKAIRRDWNSTLDGA